MAAGLLAAALYERNDLRGAQRLIDSMPGTSSRYLFTDPSLSYVSDLFPNSTIASDAMPRRVRPWSGSLLPKAQSNGCALEVKVLAEKVSLALDQNDFRMAQSYIQAMSERIGALDPEGRALEVAAGGDACSLYARLNMHLKPAETIKPLTRLVKQDLRAGWKLRGTTESNSARKQRFGSPADRKQASVCSRNASSSPQTGE